MERLYHGTSSKNLNKILEKGIQPRGKRKSNWKEYPSRSDMVYLTNAYAPFFAVQSCKKDEKALVLELDRDSLDASNVYPDEDFIAQAIAQQTNGSIEDVHDAVRDNLEDYQHHTDVSLGNLGNACYKGTVPQNAITRYCLIDIKERPDLGMTVLDPSISLLNYKFCGSRYRSIISWLFGDRADFEISIGPNDTWFQMMEAQKPGYTESIKTFFTNRAGIEVVESKIIVPC